MSEARTKLDILYQDVLGDVREILDHMDALKAGIPSAFEGSILKLKIHTDHLSARAELLNQSANYISKKIDAYATAAALSAGNAVKKDIRQSIAESLNTQIYESLLPTIEKASTDSEDLLKKLLAASIKIENKISADAEKAIGALETAIDTLKVSVEEEGKKIEDNKWELLLHTSIGALFGTGAAIGIAILLYILFH